MRETAPAAGRARRDDYVLIGVVAERFGVHPQTLRLYEREGLIRPPRSSGNTRLYDRDTVERLEIILTLTRDLGVNLAGVEVILDLRARLSRMEGEVERADGRLPRRGRRPRLARGGAPDRAAERAGPAPEGPARPPARADGSPLGRRAGIRCTGK